MIYPFKGFRISKSAWHSLDNVTIIVDASFYNAPNELMPTIGFLLSALVIDLKSAYFESPHSTRVHSYIDL